MRNRRKCIGLDLYKCDAVWTCSKVCRSCILRFTHRAWSHVVSSVGSMKNMRTRMSTMTLVVVFDRLGNCIANFIFAMPVLRIRVQSLPRMLITICKRIKQIAYSFAKLYLSLIFHLSLYFITATVSKWIERHAEKNSFV